MFKTFSSREYDLSDGRIVSIEIFEPEEEGKLWRGLSFVRWPSGDEKAFPTLGVDKLDALLNSMKLAKIFLESREECKAGHLTWLSSSDLGLATLVDPEIGGSPNGNSGDLP